MKLVFQPLFHIEDICNKVCNAALGNKDNQLNKLIYRFSKG